MDPSELNRIAIHLGSRPDYPEQPEAQPYSLTEESIPLWSKVQGSDTYKKKLINAAVEIYGLLQADHEVLRYATTGSKVVINGKERGVIALFTDHRKAKYITALEHILHSLAYIASHPQVRDVKGHVTRLRYVGIPMAKRDFHKTEYAHLDYQSVASSIYALAIMAPLAGTNEPLIIYTAGRYSQTEKRGIRTRIAPQKALMDWMISRGLIFVDHPDSKRNKSVDGPMLRVRDKVNKDRVDVLERPLSEVEAVLPELNKRLSRQRLDIAWPNYASYEACWDYANARSKVNLSGQRTLWRQFVGQDGHGGRLIGHCVQQLPRAARNHLLIDGMPTAEADYNAMQLRLLYAEKNLNTPSGDLYACDRPSWRDLMKSVLTMSVGCRTKAETIQAIQKYLYETGKASRHSAENLYNVFWSYHTGLCPHADDEDSAWSRLQNKESDLVLRILSRLLQHGIVAIPIHDSFIVQRRYLSTLVAEMRSVFVEIYPNTDIKVEAKHTTATEFD